MSTFSVNKINEFTGHEGAIYALQYNANEAKIYSAGFDNIIVEWNIEQPEYAKALAKLPSKTISLKYIEELQWLLAGQVNGDVHIIDLNLKKEIHLLRQHSDMVFDMLYNAEHDELYVCSGDGYLSVWQVSDWSLKEKINLNSKKLRAIKRIKNKLYIGCGDGTIKIIDRDSLDLIDSISEHMDDFSVNCLGFINAKDFLISGSRDGHINAYAIKDNFELKARIPAHHYAVYDIAFSDDQKYFVTVSRDKSIKLWRSDNLGFVLKIDQKHFESHTGSINAVLWVKNRLITTGDDRKIIVWDIKRSAS